MSAHRRWSRLNWLVLCVAGLATTVAYALFALRVDNTVYPADVEAIKSLNVNEKCAQSRGDFEREFGCVRAVQQAVQAVGKSVCTDKGLPIEPSDVVARGYACCYERARFIEKALRHHGFETRHVFLIEPALGWSLTNMLPLGQPSHAATEVLTSRGWMGVDSIEPFVLIDESGTPHDYMTSKTSTHLRAQMQPKDFYERDLDIVHGLYSRHGQFFGPNLPGPEFALEELHWNFQSR